MIPYQMANVLHEKASEPKKLVLFPNGDHDDVFYQPGYMETWASYLKETLGVTRPDSVVPENAHGNLGNP